MIMPLDAIIIATSGAFGGIYTYDSTRECVERFKRDRGLAAKMYDTDAIRLMTPEDRERYAAPQLLRDETAPARLEAIVGQSIRIPGKSPYDFDNSHSDDMHWNLGALYLTALEVR